jgi:hypothetical protein
MPERKRITVVNDNPEFLGLMQDVLQDASYPATLIDGDRENAREPGSSGRRAVER